MVKKITLLFIVLLAFSSGNAWAVNRAPTALGGSARTAVDQPVVIGLNATDLDGDALTFSITQSPPANQGSVVLTAEGDAVVFTPAAGFVGAASFRFKANDGERDSHPANVTVIVQAGAAANRAPSAHAKQANATTGQTVTIPLSGLDPDVGDTLSFELANTPPAHQGSVVINGDDATFTPSPTFVGVAFFSYKAVDSSGLRSAAAQVRVTYTAPANATPTAGNATHETPNNIPVTFELLGEDADGDALTYNVVHIIPNNAGSVSGPQGSTVTFTPSAGFTGTARVRYQAHDGTITSNLGEITLNILAFNGAPTVQDITEAQSAFNQPVITNLQASDAEGDALTLAVTQPANGGAVSLNGTQATFTPNAGFTGTTSYTYTAADQWQTSTPATVTVTINTPPAADDIDAGRQLSDTPVTITLQGADDDGDALTYSVDQPANGGSVSINGDEATFTPDSGFGGPVSFTYRAEDGLDSSSNATVTLTVNTAPSADAQSATTAYETPIAITLSGSDAEGDALSFSVVPGSEQNGTTTQSGNTVTFTPAPGFSGAAGFTYTADDGDLTSPPATVTITVEEPPNTPPTVADLPDLNTDYETELAITLSGSDADGDAITFSIVSGPGNGSLGAISGDTVTYTPNDSFSGEDSFTYKANDGTDDSTTATVTIEVAPNTPPVADPVADQTTDFETALTLTLTGSDAESASVSFAVDTPPPVAEGSVSLDAGSGEATFTPAAGFSGSTSFNFVVNDGSVNSVPQTVNITVGEPPNTAPVVGDVNLTTAYETPQEVTLIGSDADGDPLTYSIDSPPGNGTLSVITGDSVTYTPDDGYSGPDNFTYTANDGTDDSAPGTVTIEVASNTPPEADPVADQITNFETALTLTLTGSDAESASVSFAVETPPPAAEGSVSLDAGSGEATFTPAAGFSGSTGFSFVVNDGSVNSAPETVNITVGEPPNTAPEAYDVPVGVPLTPPSITEEFLFLDADDEDTGDVLTYTIETLPTKGVLFDSTNTEITVAGTQLSDPEVVYVVNSGETGDDSFTFKANDGTADSNVATVSLLIDQQPTAEAPAGLSTPNHTPLTFNLIGDDPDGDNGDLIYNIFNPPLPEEGSIASAGSSDPSEFVFTPDASFTGMVQIEFEVCDLNSCTDPVTVEIEVTESVTLTPRPLNDTGVLFSATVMSPWSNYSDCVAVYDGAGVDLAPAQDCSHGRDAEAAAGTLTKTPGGSGHGGFDLTRIKEDGTPLSGTSEPWRCVQDNHTGLMWEVKQGTGLQNPGNTITWYDTDAYVAQVNSLELCGFDDWRLPTIDELMGIVHYDRFNPAIDTEFFPGFSGSSNHYDWTWTSTPRNYHGNTYIWVARFAIGERSWTSQGSRRLVRLVRSGQ